MSYGALAKVEIEMENKEICDVAYKALLPETRSRVTERSKASIKKLGAKIFLTIRAKDTTALRAAMNSYLRFLKVVIDLYDNLRGGML
ncbi:MAG: KEOPS complex subunit Pcc1 [Candidatus Asgardarchaeia archaeon]